jgi:hypothetical protein
MSSTDSGVLQQFRARRRMLDDGAARRQIAMQHGHGTFRLDRIGARADRILSRHLLGLRHDVAQGFAGDGPGIEIEQLTQLRHQFGNAAGMMEMLHVVVARWFQVDQNRHLAAEPVEGFEIDLVRRTVGDRSQMDQPVGRAADRLQHHLRVAKGAFRQQFAGPRPLGLGHHRSHPAACLRGAKTLGVRGWNGRAHRQR